MTKAIALVVLIISLPFHFFVFILLKLSSKNEVIFKQRRLGKDRKEFVIYKYRTMINNAEKLQKNYAYLNEADGPVFKIKNDPRFTKIGKILSHLGLDELPQLVNIIKGDMSFVGPRPLPIKEAENIPKEYNARFSVLPGVTSLWVLQGAHNQTFKKWMESDLYYISYQSISLDIYIILRTALVFLKIIYLKLKNIFLFLFNKNVSQN